MKKVIPKDNAEESFTLFKIQINYNYGYQSVDSNFDTMSNNYVKWHVETQCFIARVTTNMGINKRRVLKKAFLSSHCPLICTIYSSNLEQKELLVRTPASLCFKNCFLKVNQWASLSSCSFSSNWASLKQVSKFYI